MKKDLVAKKTQPKPTAYNWRGGQDISIQKILRFSGDFQHPL